MDDLLNQENICSLRVKTQARVETTFQTSDGMSKLENSSQTT